VEVFMKLASYTATRAGWVGICNRLIRWRFGGDFWKDGQASHTEVIFEPTDGVDDLMPDGTTQPDENGAVWCGSSAALDVIPDWAPRRKGKTGGVRMKRIVLDPDRWEIKPYRRDPRWAARWFRSNEGYRYDWSMIVGFVAWLTQLLIKLLVPATAFWSVCSSAAAAAGGYKRPEFYHPELIRTMLESETAEVL
jgi:hypothetical protein